MLLFLLIGLISGWFAGMISRGSGSGSGSGFGLWGDLATGVVGSFIGGYLFKLMGISAYGIIGSIISSTIGAIILLWVIRMFHVSAPAYKKK